MLAKRQDHNRTDNSGVVLCLCRWPPRRRRSTQLAVYRRATASVTWIEYEVAWPSLACRCKTSASARTRHEAFTALLLLLWFERIVWRVTGRCLLPKEFLKIKPCLAWSSAETSLDTLEYKKRLIRALAEHQQDVSNDSCRSRLFLYLKF